MPLVVRQQGSSGLDGASPRRWRASPHPHVHVHHDRSRAKGGGAESPGLPATAKSTVDVRVVSAAEWDEVVGRLGGLGTCTSAGHHRASVLAGRAGLEGACLHHVYPDDEVAPPFFDHWADFDGRPLPAVASRKPGKVVTRSTCHCATSDGPSLPVLAARSGCPAGVLRAIHPGLAEGLGCANSAADGAWSR